MVGKQWHGIVECLVILSCMVNACAGLVETAQALDSFLASYVFGNTYAIALPSLDFISWDSNMCTGGTYIGTAVGAGTGADIGHGYEHIAVQQQVHESKTKACTPFHNTHQSVFSLGYLLCFLAFYPLGRHDLKETMLVQKLSFIGFFVLIFLFMWEFQDRGYEYVGKVPTWGSNWSQLAGVILFNYAYPITIPSWLTEKNHYVPVNKIIWISSAMATVIYIVFGIAAAASFNSPGK